LKKQYRELTGYDLDNPPKDPPPKMKQEAEFEASSGPSEHLGGPAPEKP